MVSPVAPVPTIATSADPEPWSASVRFTNTTPPHLVRPPTMRTPGSEDTARVASRSWAEWPAAARTVIPKGSSAKLSNATSSADWQSVRPASNTMSVFIDKLVGQRASTLVTTTAFVLIAGLTFVNAVVLTNALGAQGRGAVATAYGATVVLGWAFQFGMPAAAGYYAKDVDQQAIMNAAWRMCFVGALPFALLLTPFYLWQLDGKAFDQGGSSLQVWYLAFVAIHILQSPFQAAVYYLRGMGSTVLFNVLLALPQLFITTGYLVLLALDRLTVTSALTSTMVAMTSGWAIALTLSRSWPKVTSARSEFTRMRSYGLRSWVGSLSFIVSLRVDQMILVGLVSLEDLGVYAVSAALATLSGPVSRGIGQSLQPFIRHAATDVERIARIDRSLRWVAMASLSIVVPLAVAARVFVPWVFGDEFSRSVTPLLLLLPGSFASDVNQVLSTALSGFNRPELASKAQVVSALTTVAGLAVLLGPFGIEGAAITSSASYAVAMLVAAWYWRALKRDVRSGLVTGHTDKDS